MKTTDEWKPRVEGAKIPVNNNKNKDPFKLFSGTGNWNINIVGNPEAPELFSRKAVNGFSIFCGVIFGGIMMSLNLRNLGEKKGSIIVLLYSLVYQIFAIFLFNELHPSISTIGLVNMLGAIGLYNIFWKKYVGEKTKYRRKSIMIPLVIGILINLSFAFLIFG